MADQSYCPVVQDGKFNQKLTFKNMGVYPITVLAADAAGNRSTVARNVIYCPSKRTDDHKGVRDREKNRERDKYEGDRERD